MAFNLLHDEDNKIYYFEIEGKIAKIEYNKILEKIFITHTEVPKELSGRGIASALINAVFHEIEKSKLKLISRCPFVSSYIEKHPEWNKIVFKK